MRRVAALAAALLLGCGGGGTEYLTRGAETTLDRDALVLAARDATGTLVPLSLARALDGELRSARASQPALAAARAALDYDPHRIQVTIADDAPWRTAWDANGWRTAVPGLDAVLEPLRPVGVRKFSAAEGQTTYELTFEAWIRAKAVAYLLYDKHPAISRAAVLKPADGDDSGDLFYAADPATREPEFTASGTVYHRSGSGWSAVKEGAAPAP